MYNYADEKPKLSTPEGMRTFLAIRDETMRLIKLSGAARAAEIMKVASGNTWTMMAAFDYLIELDEIREVTNGDTPGQHRVFVGRK